jgi:hypothetical protein
MQGGTATLLELLMWQFYLVFCAHKTRGTSRTFLKYFSVEYEKNNFSNLAIILASVVFYFRVKEGVKQEGF